MNLAPDFVQQYFDSSGNPLSGGKVYTYVAGTTTPLSSYTDSSGVTSNANPVILDSAGRANIWLDPTLSYKMVIKDSSDNTIKTVDTIAGSSASGIPTWNSNTTYSQGSIVADGSGEGLLYVSLQNSNLNNALTNVSYWRVFGGKVRTLTANTTLAVTDEVVRSNTTSGNLTMTLPACSTTPIGKRIAIKDVGTSTTNVTTLKGSGSDNVDGANTYASTIQRNDTVIVENNGTSWDVVSVSGRRIPPTIQKFTSGSGTYTTPTSPRIPVYIRVRMVGAGGGGGGLNAGASNGGAGGDTTFGTALLTAKGGAGGTSAGIGGAATTGSAVNSPATGTVIEGGAGGMPGGSTANSCGGHGGVSVFGGAGQGGYPATTDGTAGATNSGSGGGGAQNAGASGAGGGAAGAYVDAIITGPSATYSYAVGAAGTAGAGTRPGGAGGSGYIEVTEYYQ